MSRLGSTIARLKLKGIDGDPHKRWSIWFNSTISEEPYLDLTSREFFRNREVPSGTRWQVLHGCRQLVPWGVRLSPWTSATLVLCCIFHRRLPASSRRKVRMTSNQHGPYVQGYTGATMAGTTGSQAVMRSQSFKACLSSDWGLKLALMKLESLVNVHQQWRVEYVPGSCTHRPSSHERWGRPKSQTRSGPKVKPLIGTKS